MLVARRHTRKGNFMRDSKSTALKILALVDEFPSEPLSFERRQLENRIESVVANFTQHVDNERDAAYEYGHEDGYDEGYQQATDEFEARIQELEEEIADLKQEQENGNQDAFAEGYESARIEYGLN